MKIHLGLLLITVIFGCNQKSKKQENTQISGEITKSKDASSYTPDIAKTTEAYLPRDISWRNIHLRMKMADFVKIIRNYNGRLAIDTSSRKNHDSSARFYDLNNKIVQYYSNEPSGGNPSWVSASINERIDEFLVPVDDPLIQRFHSQFASGELVSCEITFQPGSIKFEEACNKISEKYGMNSGTTDLKWYKGMASVGDVTYDILRCKYWYKNACSIIVLNRENGNAEMIIQDDFWFQKMIPAAMNEYRNKTIEANQQRQVTVKKIQF
jgi:hypothetical protein